MKQVDLANQIGVTDRTIRRMSKRKRQQWQSLAAKSRDVSWFDLLAQLCFEVDAHNAADKETYYSLELGKHVNSLVCYTNQKFPRLLWVENFDNADAIARVIEKVKQLDGVKE